MNFGSCSSWFCAKNEQEKPIANHTTNNDHQDVITSGPGPSPASSTSCDDVIPPSKNCFRLIMLGKYIKHKFCSIWFFLLRLQYFTSIVSSINISTNQVDIFLCTGWYRGFILSCPNIASILIHYTFTTHSLHIHKLCCSWFLFDNKTFCCLGFYWSILWRCPLRII